MTRGRSAWRLAALGVAAMAAACGGSGGGPTDAANPEGGGISTSTSHNAGRDCLACHREFRVAGTVYRADGSTYPGATVRLTTAADGGGGVVLSVTADRSGNFYSSQAVAFGSGLYTEAAGTGGVRRSMQSAVTSGACNACHDASNRIRAD